MAPVGSVWSRTTCEFMSQPCALVTMPTRSWSETVGSGVGEGVSTGGVSTGGVVGDGGLGRGLGDRGRIGRQGGWLRCGRLDGVGIGRRIGSLGRGGCDHRAHRHDENGGAGANEVVALPAMVHFRNPAVGDLGTENAVSLQRPLHADQGQSLGLRAVLQGSPSDGCGIQTADLELDVSSAASAADRLLDDLRRGQDAVGRRRRSEFTPANASSDSRVPSNTAVRAGLRPIGMVGRGFRIGSVSVACGKPATDSRRSGRMTIAGRQAPPGSADSIGAHG